MNNFLLYLLESSVCTGLFYSVYHFVLRKDSFHNLLRGYILFSIITSLAIPQIPNEIIPRFHGSAQPDFSTAQFSKIIPQYAQVFNELTIVNPTWTKQKDEIVSITQVQNAKLTSMSFTKFIFIIYLLGVFLFSVRFILNIIKIIFLIKRNERVKLLGLNIIYLKSDSPSFSFLNFIFLHKNNLYASDVQQIITHEKIHVRQWHSLDILFIELVKIVMWFNLCIWLFKVSLARLHEFYADEQLIKQTNSLEEYKELLLRQYLGNFSIELVHPFNSSPLKTRIAMMNKAKSGKTARLKLLFALPVLAIGLLSFTKTGTTFTENQSDQNSLAKIEELVNYYLHTNQLNGNIVVYQNGDMVYEKSVGYADFKTKRELNITTPFLLGTVTEPFTSLAIMILKEQGKLKYSDSLSQYFTDLPAFMDPITVQQLLNRTSGIPPSDDYWPVATGVSSNNSIYQVIRKMNMLYFKPGTDYQESSSNYILLAIIIEKVTGLTYQQFVKSNILLPSKMKDSYFLDEDNFMGNKRAIGYNTNGELFDYPQFTLGNSGIVSTISDLHKFETCLYSGKIVSNTELNKALTQTKLENGNDPHYSYGFQLFGEKNDKMAGHYSWYGGTKSLLWTNRANKSSIIALTNNSWPRFEEMTTKIMRILNNKSCAVPFDRVPIEISPDSLKSLAGNYKLDKGNGDIKIKLENNKPYIFYNNSDKSYQLYAETTGRFFIKEYDLEFIFQRNEADSISGFIIHGDEDTQCSRVQ